MPTLTLTDPYLPATPSQPDRDGVPVKVYRYDPAGTPVMTYMPNVQALACERHEGPQPGTAVFRYDLTSTATGAPHTPEQAVDTAFTGALVVKENDRLVIKLVRPDATEEPIFDGNALTWHIVLTDDAEEAQIEAVGVFKQEWATPLPGALMRDGDAPATVSDHPTDVVAQFNPKGQPNATPTGADAGTSGSGFDKKYPTFLDPLIVRSPDVRRTWTLPLAARHILFGYNDEAYVTSPDGTDLDALLVSKVPVGSAAFDPNDPGTYNTKDIVVPDTPLTGRDWPSLLYDLIRDYGFGMTLNLTADPVTGAPKNALELFYRQAGTQKPILIQAGGVALDRSLTNCDRAEVTRDLTETVNEWWVEGAVKRYEVSVILQCGFPSAAADAASFTSLAAYEKSDPTYTTTNRDKYRLYVFDETGEGHYPPGVSTAVSTAPSLDAALGSGNYAKRRRKPVGELITKDTDGKTRRARLAISTDSTQAAPALWDGTGTWQPVHGGWELLKDRLGVRLTADNPNRWKIGESKVTGHPYPVGVVKGVEDQANATTPFRLRLTCVIEGDRALVGKATRRTASPVGTAVVRKIDARDRYRLETVTAHSEFNTTTTATVPRDDTAAAEAEAAAVRYTTEAGVLNSVFRIDHLTTAYTIGDRLTQIQGRGTPLRTDAGLTGENPYLPVVTSVRWEFYPEQWTVLHATDAGSGRGRYQRVTGRKKPVGRH